MAYHCGASRDPAVTCQSSLPTSVIRQLAGLSRRRPQPQPIPTPQRRLIQMQCLSSAASFVACATVAGCHAHGCGQACMQYGVPFSSMYCLCNVQQQMPATASPGRLSAIARWRLCSYSRCMKMGVAERVASRFVDLLLFCYFVVWRKGNEGLKWPPSSTQQTLTLDRPHPYASDSCCARPAYS